MEEEISLHEIATILWKGKLIIISITLAAIIITALISIFMITPLYRATAMIDLTPFNLKTADFIDRNVDDGFTTDPLEYLIEDTGAVVSAVSLSEKGGLLTVTVEEADPQLAVAMADAVALAIVYDSGKNLQATLVLRIEELECSIDYFEEKINELFGNKVSIQTIEYITEYLIDPVYLRLRQEQGQLMAELYNARLAYENINYNKQVHPEYLVTKATLPTQPVNMRWQLNTAVAGVLGLMLSVFIVFIRPHFADIIK